LNLFMNCSEVIALWPATICNDQGKNMGDDVEV
jgi:hypothetical protein